MTTLLPWQYIAFPRNNTIKYSFTWSSASGTKCAALQVAGWWAPRRDSWVHPRQCIWHSAPRGRRQEGTRQCLQKNSVADVLDAENSRDATLSWSPCVSSLCRPTKGTLYWIEITQAKGGYRHVIHRLVLHPCKLGHCTSHWPHSLYSVSLHYPSLQPYRPSHHRRTLARPRRESVAPKIN